MNGKQMFDSDLIEYEPDEIAAFEKYRQNQINE